MNAGNAPPKQLPTNFRVFQQHPDNPDWANKIIAGELKPTAFDPFDKNVLLPNYRTLTNAQFHSIGQSKRIFTMLRYHEVTPDVLPRKLPKVWLCVDYGKELVHRGNFLQASDLKTAPKVTFIGDETALYTIILVDPDFPSREAKAGQIVHWMISNIRGSDINTGATVCPYISPCPSANSGFHRYTYILAKQGQALETSERPRHITSVKQMLKVEGLEWEGVAFAQVRWDPAMTEIQKQHGLPQNYQPLEAQAVQAKFERNRGQYKRAIESKYKYDLGEPKK